MPQNNVFSVPQNGAVLAAYQYSDGALTPCPDQVDVDEHLPVAELSLAVWDAAQRLDDAALMVLKSGGGVSIGTLNGGLIVEGRSKLNVGLIRAATRGLDPVRMKTAAKSQLASEDRFRRSFWTVASRLHGAVVPRAFQFELAGTHGMITTHDDQLTFTGDFSDPVGFVNELRAACEGEKEVQYTLGPFEDVADSPRFDLSDLIKEAVPVADANGYSFDKEGWVTRCPSHVDFGMIQKMSAMTRALYARDAGIGDTTIAVLSSANLPIVRGSVMADGGVQFEIP